MSRRSLISAEENLIRSQRRGVPNVRMWSEQETPPQVAWDGYEEEPAFVSRTLPDALWWVNTHHMRGIGGDSATLTGLHVGSPAIVGFLQKTIGNGAANGPTLPQGWAFLDTGSIGPNTFGIIATTAAPATTAVFPFTGSDLWEVDMSGLVLQGASGGALHAVLGDARAASETYWKEPPAWAVRAQILLAGNLYSDWDPGDPRLAGFPSGHGTMAASTYWPTAPTPQNTAPGASMIPEGTRSDWSASGAYGFGAGVTYAIGWD